MSTGQMLLSLCAMMLLSLVVLRQTGDSLETSDTILQTKVEIMAASEASSMLERISSLAFDQHTKDSTFTGKLSQLTPPSALGPDGGEDSTHKYNDADDYNGFVTVDSTALGEFTIHCKVTYADAANPDVDYVANPTWHKKVTVTVWGPRPAMTDSMQCSTIVSYWYFH
jgi:hypothetical protein